MIGMAFYIAGLIILVPIAFAIIVGIIRLLLTWQFWAIAALAIATLWLYAQH